MIIGPMDQVDIVRTPASYLFVRESWNAAKHITAILNAHLDAGWRVVSHTATDDELTFVFFREAETKLADKEEKPSGQ